MDGYLIALKHDDELQPKYWATNDTTQNLNDALFISDIVSARRTAATLQNQFLDHTISIVPVFKGVQLKNVVSAITS